MEGSEIVVKDLAIGCHNFRIVTGNEERNCIAIPLNSALIVGFVGDVSSVIRRIEQQPVFEPLLLDALVNSLRKLFKNPCSQAELNKIVPFGFSLQRQKNGVFLPLK